jgi:hypothetical protein
LQALEGLGYSYADTEIEIVAFYSVGRVVALGLELARWSETGRLSLQATIYLN